MIPELENRKWKVLTSEKMLDRGVWMRLRKERVQLPSGVEVPEWFILDFPNWVNVIAITKDGKFVMEDQYRHAVGETHFELVAGVIDDGETPLEAAKRELSEESGYGGGTWEEFLCVAPNPTNQSNYSYTFLATGVEKIGEQHTDASEDICVHLFTRDEIRELLETGKIIQAMHLAPLWKYFAETDRR